MAEEENEVYNIKPMSGIKPPSPLIFDDGNIISNWKLFLQKWNNYKILTNLEAQSEQYQVALLLHTLGDEALKRYNGFKFDFTEEDRTVEEIVEKFNQYIVGEVNEIYERYMFNMRKQEDNETFDTFLSAIRVLVKTCNYCDVCINSLIRDRIVLGVRDVRVQEQLLRERSLTLDRCIDICRASEYAQEKGKVFRPDSINKIKFDKNDKRKCTSFKNAEKEFHSCKFCGKKHKFVKEQCPAWGKTCAKCQKKNHFARQCKTYGGKQKAIHQLNDDSVKVDWINNIGDNSEVQCAMIINEKRVKFQIDTGASVNLLPRQFASGATQTSNILKMWDGSVIKPLGVHREFVINPKNGKRYNIEFTIVDNKGALPLLGLKAAVHMKLVTIEEDQFQRINNVQLNDYKELFSEGIGSLPGLVHLETDPNISPTTMPIHRVPIAMRGRLQEELSRLEEKEVITKVSEPTPWINNIVIVEKSNRSLRLCLNPLELNKALQRPRLMMPSLDDVLHEVSGAKYFSKLDLQNGYWHVKLDDSSSLLTTFQTPFGRYRWLRLPFGLNVAPEVFQQKMKEAFADLPGLLNIADDIVIYGKNEREHDDNLAKFLNRCKELNVKLNQEKCELKCNEITFMGHKISHNGIRPDPLKIKAVLDMKNPENVEELRRFLGMCNYRIRFLPGYADVVEPLLKLLKHDVPWNWNESHANAVRKLKKLLTETPTLKIFDCKKAVQIECDASQYGLGAVLLQDSSVITYASRTLNTSERNYAQIEKEMLAVIWSLEKFHHYVYGRKTTVYTDHKPLEAIKKKPLHKAPRRLQNMLMRAQQYDFELCYRPGKQIPVPDALSRAPLEVPTEDQSGEKSGVICSIQMLPIKGNCLERIIEECTKDEEMLALKEMIIRGWPHEKKDVSPSVSAYFEYRDELGVQNGVIVRGERIIIPKSIRKEIKEKLHMGHQGVNSCLRRARELVFWPGMSSEIRMLVGSCHTCLSYSDKLPSEMVKWHELPNRPWQKIGVDIFVLKERHYLVTVDYFSQFIEVDYLIDTTSTTVIGKLKHHFARYGIPEVLITGGDTQLKSNQFNKFCTNWEITHKITSPYNSRSNGRVS